MTLADFYQRVAFNGRVDREINEWKILDVHQIPDPILEQDEIDFYCCNDKAVYLLRLRNRTTKKFSIVNGEIGLGYPTYLIAELPIKKIDAILLENILTEFLHHKG